MHGGMTAEEFLAKVRKEAEAPNLQEAGHVIVANPANDANTENNAKTENFEEVKIPEIDLKVFADKKEELVSRLERLLNEGHSIYCMNISEYNSIEEQFVKLVRDEKDSPRSLKHHSHLAHQR